MADKMDYTNIEFLLSDFIITNFAMINTYNQKLRELSFRDHSGFNLRNKTTVLYSIH